MHSLLKNANDGIQEMLEMAARVKGDAFLNVASAMLLQHQQIWMAEVMLGFIDEEDEAVAKDLAALVKQQAEQTIDLMARFLSEKDCAEARLLAEQMINRQRSAARQYEERQR